MALASSVSLSQIVEISVAFWVCAWSMSCVCWHVHFHRLFLWFRVSVLITKSNQKLILIKLRLGLCHQWQQRRSKHYRNKHMLNATNTESLLKWFSAVLARRTIAIMAFGQQFLQHNKLTNRRPIARHSSECDRNRKSLNRKRSQQQSQQQQNIKRCSEDNS